VRPLLNKSRQACAPIYPAPPATRMFGIIEIAIDN
jgi:hypothetical protein